MNAPIETGFYKDKYVHIFSTNLVFQLIVVWFHDLDSSVTTVTACIKTGRGAW